MPPPPNPGLYPGTYQPWTEYKFLSPLQDGGPGRETCRGTEFGILQLRPHYSALLTVSWTLSQDLNQSRLILVLRE